MLAARLAALAVSAVALVAAAPAQGETAPAAPTGLHGFLLRADEPAATVFPRTPSFAWSPVRGAVRYEFQLSTSSLFREGGIVYSTEDVTVPAVSVPVALPWITGNPYSLYARVRAILPTGATAWSDSYGFNMRWTSLPAPMTTYAGLIRWTPVEGATGYDVWFANTEPAKVISTITNVADEREFYAFHQDDEWISSIKWRVRAKRFLYGASRNGLPAVSYGPWSPLYTTVNPSFATGTLSTFGTVSDVITDATSAQAAHGLVPGFLFSGNKSAAGTAYELYRVYVFTDQDCVNMVYRGAIVGGPAYAPRTTGPLALPSSTDEIAEARDAILPDGLEGATFTFDNVAIATTESDKPVEPDTDSDAAEASSSGASTGSASSGSGSSSSGSSSGSGDEGGTDSESSSESESSSSSSSSSSKSDSPLPVDTTKLGAPVGLWDTDWPKGGYYWTVVPVEPVSAAPIRTSVAALALIDSTTVVVANASGFSSGDTIAIGRDPSVDEVTIVEIDGTTLTVASPLKFSHGAGEPIVRTSGGLEYRDRELPADACAAGRVKRFGKSSEPVVATGTTPYVSGLSPSGRLVSASGAAPVFYGTPLVAWGPAAGAQAYEVQWSATEYPFKSAGSKFTFATSVSLPLSAGTWYYRVRGLSFALPGKGQRMSWTDPVKVVVAKPTFSIVGGSVAGKTKVKGTAFVRRYASGFSIAVPPAWRTITVPGVEFAARNPKVEKGFFTNVNVIAQPGRGATPFTTWKAQQLDSLKALKPIGLASSTVTLPSGRAVKVSYRWKSAGTELYALQYLVDAGEQSFVVTFTTLPSLVKKYAVTFAAAAKSFKTEL